MTADTIRDRKLRLLHRWLGWPRDGVTIEASMLQNQATNADPDSNSKMRDQRGERDHPHRKQRRSGRGNLSPHCRAYSPANRTCPSADNSAGRTGDKKAASPTETRASQSRAAAHPQRNKNSKPQPSDLEPHLDDQPSSTSQITSPRIATQTHIATTSPVIIAFPRMENDMATSSNSW